MSKKILAWHFTNGLKLRDGQPLVVGKTYVHDGYIVMCVSGLHASIKAIDALNYAPGLWVSRVECEDIVDQDLDKFVCHRRTVLACADATKTILEWSANTALAALLITETTDNRLYAAIEAIYAYIKTGVWSDEMEAACTAAGAAACTAAWEAAWEEINTRLETDLSTLLGVTNA